jgi:hypothetical protein
MTFRTGSPLVLKFGNAPVPDGPARIARSRNRLRACRPCPRRAARFAASTRCAHGTDLALSRL